MSETIYFGISIDAFIVLLEQPPGLPEHVYIIALIIVSFMYVYYIFIGKKNRSHIF